MTAKSVNVNLIAFIKAENYVNLAVDLDHIFMNGAFSANETPV